MSSPADPERRYPKRQRTAVAYREAAGNEGETDEDSETVATITDSSATAKIEAESSDKDEDWTQKKPNNKKRSKKPKAIKPRIKKPEPFPFLHLPAELREAVYKLVVGSPDDTVFIEPSFLTNNRLRRTLDEAVRRVADEAVNWQDRKRFRNLRFLRVSKLIYQEAAVAMYTKQKFIFSRLSALQSFLLLLRPKTLDRLIHIQVDVADTEWHFMPGVASQMLQLHYLQTLKINGLNYTTSSRNFAKYLNSTGRSESTWQVSIESFDKMMGIKLARDIYPFMYTFFHGVIRAKAVVVEEFQPAGSMKPEAASSDISQPGMTKDLDSTAVQKLGVCMKAGEESIYPPLIGVDALVQVLELGEKRLSGWYDFVGRWPWKISSFSQFQSRPLTDERRSTRRNAMKEELLTLMAKDSF